MAALSSDAAAAIRVGIAGATGAVGLEMAAVLKDRKFPGLTADNLFLYASQRSSGKVLDTAWGKKTVQAYSLETALQVDILLLAVSGSFSTAQVPLLLEQIEAGQAKGSPHRLKVIIDNSSAFRYDDRFPLVIPEINTEAAFPSSKPRSSWARFVANPNCSTAVAVVALWPLHRHFGLKKVIVSTYQAASGAGVEGMAELKDGARAVLEADARGEDVVNLSAPKVKIFAHSLPFNVVPHIDKFQDNGYTKEEMKVAWETRKIFATAGAVSAGEGSGLPFGSETAKDIKVSTTAVRVPTLRAHAEAITIETTLPITPAKAREILAAAPGVELVDDTAAARYPMPLNASRKYDVEVGRVRQSLVFGDCGIDLFLCGDQLLKGAALNAVQIAEAWASGESKE